MLVPNITKQELEQEESSTAKYYKNLQNTLCSVYLANNNQNIPLIDKQGYMQARGCAYLRDLRTLGDDSGVISAFFYFDLDEPGIQELFCEVEELEFPLEYLKTLEYCHGRYKNGGLANGLPVYKDPFRGIHYVYVEGEEESFNKRGTANLYEYLSNQFSTIVNSKLGDKRKTELYDGIGLVKMRNIRNLGQVFHGGLFKFDDYSRYIQVGYSKELPFDPSVKHSQKSWNRLFKELHQSHKSLKGDDPSPTDLMVLYCGKKRYVYIEAPEHKDTTK